jgi:pimeloyl-ACP methyl ester carboxylesterase
VVAYSMGARLALEALFYYGAPFLSLTCLSATLEVENKVWRRLQEVQWIDQLKNNSIEEFINNWYTQKIFDNFKPPKRRYTQNKEALIQILQEYSILNAPSFLPDIFKSKVPIQFIFRNNDPKAIPLKGFSGVYFINGSSHSIHLEYRILTSNVIKKILTL